MRFFRFASPASMLFSGVLFLLPWIELRCDRHVGKEVQQRDMFEISSLQLGLGGGTRFEDGILQEYRLTGETTNDDMALTRWLAIAYGGVALMGLLAAVFCVPPRRRALLVGAMACVALGLLGGIKARHPEVDGVPRKELTGKISPAMPTEPLAKETMPPERREIVVIENMHLTQARFTAWYWLSYVANGLCLGLCLLELRSLRVARVQGKVSDPPQ